MAVVQPFRALRYAPSLDLSQIICPPFDTISPHLQQVLYDRSLYNAVRIELAKENGGSRYENAASELARFIDEGVLVRDESPAYYVHSHTFKAAGSEYTRRVLFARLLVTPWEAREVLPHEQTFGAPKEDRIQNMRATGINASPVFLIYHDAGGEVARNIGQGADDKTIQFEGEDGERHELAVIDGDAAAEIRQALSGETLYIADGHHRYETALAYRDEVRAAADTWTGDEPENFALVALAAANDPGLVVLPIHRVTRGGDSWKDVRTRLESMFEIVPVADAATAVAERAGGSAFGLIARENESDLLLTVRDRMAVERALPQDRSADWRSLDYSVANHAIMQACLGLAPAQMQEYKTVQFTADAREAATAVRSGDARYAVIMNPISVHRVLELAGAGERMPQKSTFFYPKVPTGLVFNPVRD